MSMLTEDEENELGLTNEAAECGAAGMRFVNVVIADRSVPQDRGLFLRMVERLAELVREGHHVAVHCRASIGRSSLLAASLLVRLGWDANAAFDAIQIARGCQVPDTPEQRRWVTANIQRP